jgi:hypothetical protein
MSGAHGAERMPRRQGVADEIEETALRQAWNHIEGHEGIAGADDILVVGIEDAEVVSRPIVGGGGDFLKPERGEPVVDFRLGDGDDVEPGLGGDDAEVARLGDHAFEQVETGDEQVVKFQTFEVLEGSGFPEMEAAGICSGRDQGEFDAGVQAEDAVLGEFPITVRGLLVPDVVFLAAFDRLGRQILGIQQETQTLRPSRKTSFLAGECALPRWESISR